LRNSDLVSSIFQIASPQTTKYNKFMLLASQLADLGRAFSNSYLGRKAGIWRTAEH